jgi:hypothetical protein
LKVIAVILGIIIVLLVIAICLNRLAPDSAAAVMIQSMFDNMTEN